MRKTRLTDEQMVAAIHYRTGSVFIRFIGTHADYDEIDATTI